MTTRADLDTVLTEQQRGRPAHKRQRLRRQVLGAVAAPPLVIVVGMLTWHSNRGEGPTPWFLILSVVAFAVGWMALAAFFGRRQQEGSPSTRRLVLSGDRPTIRRVRRSLRRAEPIADDDLEVARAIALAVQDQRWSSFLPPLVISVSLLLPVVLPRDAGDALAGWEVTLRLTLGAFFVVSAVVTEVLRRLVLRGAEKQRIWHVRAGEAAWR